MWALELASGDSRGGEILRLGQQRVALSDIAGVSREDVVETDMKGKALMAFWFILAASLFVMGVVEWGWRTRFLLASFVTFAIAMTCLSEAARPARIGIVRLTIRLKTGGAISFASPHPDDASRLEDLIGRRVQS